MTTRIFRYGIIIAATTLVLAACNPAQPEPADEPPPPDDETESEPEQEPTAVPEPTEVPPTPVPPTETPEPLPALVIDDPPQTAADGCTIATLNTESWGNIYTGYTAGADPFFQIHDTEDGFYFNVELYTVYGAGWTGQTGTFAPDCGANGICAYLVPDDVNPYLATAGEINIISLSQEGGAIVGPVELTLTNLTLQPVPGTSSSGCYHIDEVVISVDG